AVDFQSHTVFHPILPACSTERARWEVVESKEALEREHGLKIYALAYPNGDYSDREIGLLQSAGYTCGLTSDAGFNDSETDPFRLRRVVLPDDAGVNEVIVRASGLWTLLKAFRSKATNRRRHSSWRSRLVSPRRGPSLTPAAPGTRPRPEDRKGDRHAD